jgi:hypothetical protein
MGILGSITSFVSKGVANVGETFKAIASNTVNTVIGKPKEYTFSSPIPGVAKIAEHPFATAAVIATVANPKGALTAAKTVANKVASVAKSTFNQLNPLTKVGVIAASPVVVGALSSSSTLRKQVISAPSGLANFGTNIGKFADNPSLGTLKTIVKENPLISGLAGAAVAIPLAGAAYGVSNTLINASNTKAVKANTTATLKSLESSPIVTPQVMQSVATPMASSPISTPPPIATTTPLVATPKKKKAKKKKKKAKKKAKKKKKKAKKKPKKKAKKKKKKAKSIKRKKKKK